MIQTTPLSMLRFDIHTRKQLMAHENAISIRRDCCSSCCSRCRRCHPYRLFWRVSINGFERVESKWTSTRSTRVCVTCNLASNFMATPAYVYSPTVLSARPFRVRIATNSIRIIYPIFANQSHSLASVLTSSHRSTPQSGGQFASVSGQRTFGSQSSNSNVKLEGSTTTNCWIADETAAVRYMKCPTCNEHWMHRT